MRNPGQRIAIGALILIVVLAVIGWLYFARQMPPGESRWDGVDVTVIEKYAAAAGREAWAPFINTDQGDLLLFVFALGGAIGGFTAGYYWRKLMSEKKRD